MTSPHLQHIERWDRTQHPRYDRGALDQATEWQAAGEAASELIARLVELAPDTRYRPLTGWQSVDRATQFDALAQFWVEDWPSPACGIVSDSIEAANPWLTPAEREARAAQRDTRIDEYAREDA